MTVNAITGLPFQQEYLKAQKINTEQKNTVGIFGKQNNVLTQKLQNTSQAYQNKGSVFQAENLKTNIVEDGYMGKLSDQKWAKVNFEYEQNNVKLLSSSNQALENAVVRTGLNVKKYEESIATTNTKIADTNKKIDENNKQIEAISTMFANEQHSKNAEEYAKNNYENSVNKDAILNNELTSLNSNKNTATTNTEATKQKKSDADNAIASLTSNKTNISQERTSILSQKDSLGLNINTIEGQISELKGKKSVAPVTGNNVADAQIDAQISTLEASLAAKINEQAQLDNKLKSLDDNEANIDKDIENKQNECQQFDIQLSNEENILSGINNQIVSKQQEIADNNTKAKEDLYKQAIETHTADLQKRQENETRYNELIIETAALKDKRSNSNEGLKELEGIKNYFSALLEGQGNAKAGAKADLEIAQEKEAQQYETLQIKNGIVEKSRISLFSQQDMTNRAKGDLKAISTELETYANVFQLTKKA